MWEAGKTTSVNHAQSLGGLPVQVFRKGAAKVRTVFGLGGVSNPVHFGVHNNNLTNLLRGIVERVFRVKGKDGALVPPPKPAEGVFKARLAGFEQRVRRHLPRATPISTDEFVGMYKGRRRTVYAQAAESLLISPVSRKDAFLATFVKAEKVNFTSKPDPAPRVIQPRGPRYNVCVGVYLKPLEHRIYHSIAAVWGGTTVMKGHNAHSTAKELRDMWDQFKDPVAIGLDAERFDQHVGVDALRWEHGIYLKCFSRQQRRRLARLLGWQIVNKGFGRASDGKVKYVVEGCRMSGDMNTALGNCLLMCAMVWAYCAAKGIRARLANNGDDCVVIMERNDLCLFQEGLTTWFREMGFSMKVEEPVDVFERIEFCQTNPVFDGERWVMCRKPSIVLAKDSVSLLPLNQGKTAFRYATAVGECGLSLAGGLPVLQEFYSALMRFGKGFRMGEAPQLESGFARLATGMHRTYREPTPESRYSFWKAYGILPDAQVAMEEFYRTSMVDLECLVPRETFDLTFPDLTFDYGK